MSDVQIKRYDPADRQKWNDFVASAGNGTFLFNRGYMEYHADRFTDHSLLIYLRGKLCALFVANEDHAIIHSHAGLTYGGIILSVDARMEDVLSYFFHILKYYSERCTSLIYKCVPAPFQKQPSDEDRYAMFLLRAELQARNMASVFYRDAPLPYQQRRRKSVKTSATLDFRIVSSTDPGNFWNKVLVPNLKERYEASPVHTAAEMAILMQQFPEQIQLFEFHTSELVAGAVVYVMDKVAHAQYLSATQAGKDIGAMDILVDHLMSTTFGSKEYFSLGTSNEKDGSLNRGLINWKEGFGTRAYPHDIYRITLSNYKLLSDYE